MIFLISIVYFCIFAAIVFCITASIVGTTLALQIAVLMGIAAYFSSLCGYMIGKSKKQNQSKKHLK